MSDTSEHRSIGHLIGQVCRLHHVRAHTLLEKIEIHRGQPPLLYVLWEEDGRTHSEIAALLHVQPATITRMVQRMERAGFVERRDDSHDQRVSRVYLTDQGREIQSEVEAVWELLDRETFAGFTDEDRRTAESVFLRVRENLIQATGVAPDL